MFRPLPPGHQVTSKQQNLKKLDTVIHKTYEIITFIKPKDCVSRTVAENEQRTKPQYQSESLIIVTKELREVPTICRTWCISHRLSLQNN
jgi:hypothetical protein